MEGLGHCGGLGSLWRAEATVGGHCGRRKSPWTAEVTVDG